METRKISEAEFQEFLDKTYHIPHQSVGMFRRMQLGGRKPELFGGFEKGELVIAAIGGFFHFKKLFRYLYFPYGYVARNPRDTKVVQAFFSQIAAMYKGTNVLTLRLDPNVEIMPYDFQGHSHPEIWDNRKYRDEMERAGFVSLPLSRRFNEVGQSRQVSIIDLVEYEPDTFRGYYDANTKVKRHFSADELLKKMDVKTRNSVKQSIRPYIHVLETDIATLEELGKKSGDAKDFAFASEETLRQMTEGFGDACRIKLAQLNVKEYKEEAEKGIAQQQAILDKWEGKTSRKAAGKIKEASEMLAYHQKQLAEAEQFLSEGKETIDLAASMFLYTPQTTFYMFSGIDREYARFRGSNRLLFDTMEESIERGAHQFNLMGIAGNYQPDDPDFSLFAYKRGLGGRIGEYVGTFYKPVSRLGSDWLVKQLPQ